MDNIGDMREVTDESDREIYAGYRRIPRVPYPEMRERFGKEPSRTRQKRHFAEARRALQEVPAKATVRERQAANVLAPQDQDGEHFPYDNSATHRSAS